jgi:hypothetical protein
MESQVSSIGIAIGCGLDGRGSILVRSKRSSRQALRLTQPSIKWAPGVKRPGLEADNLPPSSAEIKNGGAISPLPHTSSWLGA